MLGSFESGGRRASVVEALEGRRLLSSEFANVNLSRRPGNEAEGAVAVDPSNPSRLFAFSNTDDTEPGLFATYSTDGGRTWAPGRTLGAEGGDVPPACCDPTATFDAFGNLFVGYLDDDRDAVDVLLSTDGGQSFSLLASLGEDADQPTLAAGPGGVWVTFADGSRLVAAGASVTGPGQVAPFGEVQVLPGATRSTFGDIAVGPDGRVAVTGQKGGRRGNIGANVDPDGLGPAPFGPRVVVTTTGVQLFDLVPAQPDRGVDAEAGLAYDTSAGPFRGRLYLLYTDVAKSVPRDRHNMDVFLRYSDDGGASWGNAIRVNDDPGTDSQILPRVALDETSGDLAVIWHDTREDRAGLGGGPGDDSDGKPYTDVATYAALVRPTADGLLVSPNVRVSGGGTIAAEAENGVELGDYTGLDFHAGVFFPVWADNSNSTGDNPDGARGQLDLYAARVEAAALPAPARLGLGGFPVGGKPAAQLASKKGFAGVTRGKSHKFDVTYRDADGLDPSTAAADLPVTGANLNMTAIPTRAKTARDGTSTTVTYQVLAPGGRWSPTEDGVYAIRLPEGGVKDTLGDAAPAGEIGYFLISVG